MHLDLDLIWTGLLGPGSLDGIGTIGESGDQAGLVPGLVDLGVGSFFNFEAIACIIGKRSVFGDSIGASGDGDENACGNRKNKLVSGSLTQIDFAILVGELDVVEIESGTIVGILARELDTGVINLVVADLLDGILEFSKCDFARAGSESDGRNAESQNGTDRLFHRN